MLNQNNDFEVFTSGIDNHGNIYYVGKSYIKGCSVYKGGWVSDTIITYRKIKIGIDYLKDHAMINLINNDFENYRTFIHNYIIPFIDDALECEVLYELFELDKAKITNEELVWTNSQL